MFILFDSINIPYLNPIPNTSIVFWVLSGRCIYLKIKKWKQLFLPILMSKVLVSFNERVHRRIYTSRIRQRLAFHQVSTSYTYMGSKSQKGIECRKPNYFKGIRHMGDTSFMYTALFIIDCRRMEIAFFVIACIPYINFSVRAELFLQNISMSAHAICITGIMPPYRLLCISISMDHYIAYMEFSIFWLH